MNDINNKKSSGCRFGCIAMLLTFLAISVLLAGAIIYAIKTTIPTNISAGKSSFKWSSGSQMYGEDDFPRMAEVWSCGHGEAVVVRIPLTGMIMMDEQGGMFRSSGSAVSAVKAIRRATRDRKVRGIILEINSGGGGITASDIIYKALLDFKAADDERVIVALLGDVAASGAYYVALAADTIIAHPTTLTGSIGVIMQSINVRELARKIGVEDVTIKSGDNKDLLNPFHEVKEEQRAMLQQVIDTMHTRFVKLVAKERNLEEEDVRKIADGRVLCAEDAVQFKLIDSIGYMSDARKTIAGLLDVDDTRIIRYQEDVSIFDLLSRRPGLGFNLNGILNESGDRGAKLLYQWAP